METDGFLFYTGKGEPYRNGYMGKRELDGRVAGMSRHSNDQEVRQRSDDSRSIVSLDSTGKQKSFARVMTRFAEKTSMQGVPYINSAKFLWAKVIWSILLVLAIGMMGVHLWYLCDQFFAYPKVTKVSLGFNNLRFPAVTVCNTNALHKGRFDRFDGARELKELVADLQPENLVPDQFRSDYDPTAPEDETGGIGTNGVTANTPPAVSQTAPGGSTVNQVTGGSTQMPGTNSNVATSQTNSGGPPPTGATQSGSGNSSPQTPPNKPDRRRKRFLEETDKLDVAKYDPNYVERDDDRTFKEDEFSAAVDQTTKLAETFTSLYMDINKKTRDYLGHNISDMLIGCTFAGRECDASMFQLTQSAIYGNCWSVDSEQFKVGVSGPPGGLSLTLYLEVAEYMEGINNGYGVRLLIHQPGTFPFPMEEGNHVSASFETSVGLKLISVEREQHPYGECDPDISEQFEQQYHRTYRRRACQMACQIDAVVEACGCFDDTMEELAQQKNNTLRPCRHPTERKCKREILLKVERKEVECYCPVPCSETAYEKYFSSRQWPSDSYAMVLLEGVCEINPESCKKIREQLADPRAVNYNFLKLNIYYEDLNFENITEEPEIETAQFLSDVGGAVGLWIGLSLLSLCEIAQLITELCGYAFHRIGKDNKSTKRRRGHHRSRPYEQGHPQGFGRDKDSDEQYPHAYDAIGQDKFRQSKDTPHYANEHLESRSDRRW